MVGIDLGTTFSVVAVSHNGNVTVIPNRHGKLITPSVVHYGTQGATGVTVVGDGLLLTVHWRSAGG